VEFVFELNSREKNRVSADLHTAPQGMERLGYHRQERQFTRPANSNNATNGMTVQDLNDETVIQFQNNSSGGSGQISFLNVGFVVFGMRYRNFSGRQCGQE